MRSVRGVSVVREPLGGGQLRGRGLAEKIGDHGELGVGVSKTAGPIGRRVRDLVLPRFLAMAASPKVAAKQAWIYDHRVSLPQPPPAPGDAVDAPAGATGGGD